jgi:hypothetical protein
VDQAPFCAALAPADGKRLMVGGRSGVTSYREVGIMGSKR